MEIDEESDCESNKVRSKLEFLQKREAFSGKRVSE